MKWIRTENRAGNPIQIGKAQIVPIEKVIQFQPPGMWGVFLWRRPAAVTVIQPDCSEEILQIRDQTREVQMMLLSTGLLAAILIWIVSQIRKESPKRSEHDV